MDKLLDMHGFDMFIFGKPNVKHLTYRSPFDIYKISSPTNTNFYLQNSKTRSVSISSMALVSVIEKIS